MDRDESQQLYYDEKLSMRQIAERLGCSPHKVDYWMRKFGFDRRPRNEAPYVHRHPEGDPFEIAPPATRDEWLLFGMALGLYMGEGTKPGTSVRLANTDPHLLLLFLRFLERFCGVERARVHAALNIYDDRDVGLATQWCVIS